MTDVVISGERLNREHVSNDDRGGGADLGRLEPMNRTHFRCSQSLLLLRLSRHVVE